MSSEHTLRKGLIYERYLKTYREDDVTGEVVVRDKSGHGLYDEHRKSTR